MLRRALFPLQKCVFGVVFLLTLGVQSDLLAATKTWTGAASVNWADAGNWDAGVPVNGDDVVLNGAGANRPTNQNIAGLSLTKLTISTNAAFTVTGNAITITGLAGAGYQATDNGQNVTLNIDFTITTVQTWDVATNRTTTIGGIISGAGGISKIGGGALELRNTNTYAGGTSMSAGTFRLGNNTALGSIVGNIATTGGTVNFNYSTGTVQTYNGVISGTGAVSKDNPGTIVLTAAQTYTGTTSVNGGTFRLEGNNASLQTGTLNVTNVNSVFEIAGVGTQNINRVPDGTPVNLNNGVFSLIAPPDVTVVENVGTVTVTNNGAEIRATATSNTAGLGDARVVSPNVTIQSGLLVRRIAAGTITTELGNVFSGTGVPGAPLNLVLVSHTVGATPPVYATATYSADEGFIQNTPVTFTSAASGNWNTATTWTPNGIPGANDLVIIRTNHNVAVDAPSAVSGVIFLADVAGNGTLSGASALTLGALGINVSGVNNPQPTVSCPLVLTSVSTPVATNNTLTLSGVISGAGGIVKSGGGALQLSIAAGGNSFSGGFQLEAGEVFLNSNTALGTGTATATLPLVNTFKRFALTNNSLTVANNWVLAGGGPGGGRGLIDANGVTGANNATLSGTITVTGVNSDGGHLRGPSGTGTLFLNGALTALANVPITHRAGSITYSGGGSYSVLNVTGTAVVGANNGIATNAVVTLGTIAEAVTLNLNNLNQTLGGLSLGTLIAATVNTGTGTLTVTGDIVTGGNFAHTINGILAVGANSSFNIPDTTVASELTVNAVVSGANGLNKIGTGVLLLTANNSYTGATTVRGGILRLQGDTAQIDESTSISIVSAGTLDISNAGTANVNRIGDAASVTLNNGTLSMTAPANTARSESIGQLVRQGSGNKIVLTASGTGDATITAASFSGTAPTELFRLNDTAAATELPNLLSTAGGPVVTGFSVYQAISPAVPTYFATAQYDAVQGVIGAGAAGVLYVSNATGNWNTTTIWTPNGTPGANDVVQITSAHVVTLDSNRSVSGVIFDASSAAGNGSIAGTATLTIGTQGVVVQAANAPQPAINTPIAAATPLVVTVNGTAVLTLGGAVSGAGGIVKSGTGSVTLNVANTYTGPTVVSGGILNFAADDRLGAVPGAAAPGNIVINGGIFRAALTANQTLNVNRGIAIGPTTGTGPGQIEVSGSTLTYAGIITNNGGTGQLVKSGAGALALQGANTFTGSTTILAGTLNINDDNRLGVAPGAATPGHIVINNGSLQYGAAFVLNANRGIALGATTGNVPGTIDTGANNVTYAGIIANNGAGDGRLHKNGTGTLTLTGVNTYTGGTLFSSGILSVATIGNTGVAGNLGRGGIFFNTGALQYTGATASTDRTVTTSGNGNINGNNGNHGRWIVDPNTLTVTSQILGANAIQKDGAGTLVFNANNNTFTGNLLVTAGRLVAAHANALGTNPVTGTAVQSGGSLGVQGGITLAAENLLLNGNGGGAGALVNLSGNNTINGSIELSGAAQIGASNAGETLNIASTINANFPLTVSGAGDVDISGLIGGAVGFVPGLMEVRIPGAFDITTLATGGTVRTTLVGRPPETNVKTPTGPWGDNETWVYTGQIYDADGTFSFAENIDDSVQVKILGTERLRNGGFDVPTNSALKDGETNAQAVSANANAATPLANFGTGGWFDIEFRFGNGTGGAGAVVNAVRGWNATKGFGYSASGALTFVAADFAIPASTGDLSEVDGNLRVAASNSLTKAGTGRLVLRNANTYQGATLVTAGTLVVSNTTGSATGSGAVTVSAGATLEGTGIIAGAVSSGGTVRPGGAAAGTLTINGNFTLGVAGTLNVQLDGVGASDLLVVGGNVSLDAASNFVATAANTVHGTTLTVLNNTGAAAITGRFNGLQDSAQLTVSGRPFAIRYTLGAGNNDILLIDDNIPAFAASSQSVDEGLGLAALTATDADADALTFSLVSGTLPAGITLNADGTFAGTATFLSQGTYFPVIRVTDAVQGFREATVTITIIDVGFSVLDTSVNETAGTVTISVVRSGTGTLAASVQADTANVTATAGADYTATTIVLTWGAGENGVKTFTVPILDDAIADFGETFNVVLSAPVNGLLSDATGSVLIIDDESTPLALPDTATAGQGKAQPIAVLSNDIGLGNPPITVTIIVAPANGTAVVNANNTVSYTSNAGFSGTDTFTYRVSDAAGQTSDAVVTVTVRPPPQILSQPTVQPNPVFAGAPVTGTGASDTGVITWNWGDGSPTVVGNSVNHVYAAPGNYIVVVNIISPEGLVVTQTLNVFVGLGYDGPGGNDGTGGGATPPGVTGILVGGAGAGPSQGGSGKITCNYIRRDKTTYQGSLGKLSIPADITQLSLMNLPSTLTIGAGPNMATFRFDLSKTGKGKATGLPSLEFNIKKKRFKFKAQREDLTALTEALGGPQEFQFKTKQPPVTLLVPVSLQVGNKIFLAMTFQVTYKQISNGGKGGLAK